MACQKAVAVLSLSKGQEEGVRGLHKEGRPVVHRPSEVLSATACLYSRRHINVSSIVTFRQEVRSMAKRLYLTFSTVSVVSEGLSPHGLDVMRILVGQSYSGLG